MKRSLAREKALQAIFQFGKSEITPHEAIQYVLEEKEQHDPFLHSLVTGTYNNLQEIDEIIVNHLENWSFDRLGNVDRTILRIAVYEMKYLDDVPVKVSMDEAIELAKKFGDEKSSKFVNAVLSKVQQTIS